MAIYSSRKGYEESIITISILQMRELRFRGFYDLHEGKDLSLLFTMTSPALCGELVLRPWPALTP